MKIVIFSVQGDILAGEVWILPQNERYPFSLDTEEGIIKVDKIGKNFIEWAFITKSLLPNRKVKIM